MKKIIIALTTLTTVVIACSPKVSKTGTASVQAGEALINSAKCTKCHKTKISHVPAHTFAEQEKLFLSMGTKAKLTYAETQDLMAYVMANAKK